MPFEYSTQRHRALRPLGPILFTILIVFPFYLAGEFYFLDKVYFLCPIKYKQNTPIIRSDSYGNGEFLAQRNGYRKHSGIDLEAAVGTPVYAAMGGKVLEARFDKGLGNYVEIRHHLGLVTIYGHLSKIDVQENQLLRQADKIGEVGKTGNANYRRLLPHLHLEIRIDGLPVDPREFLN